MSLRIRLGIAMLVLTLDFGSVAIAAFSLSRRARRRAVDLMCQHHDRLCTVQKYLVCAFASWFLLFGLFETFPIDRANVSGFLGA